MKNDFDYQIRPHAWALSPLIVFLCLYLVTSLIVNDFYKVPITVAFLISSVFSIMITRHLTIHERVMQFSSGAANKNIMLMIWIFILAGAFARSAKDMGAIDATVNLALYLLPGNLLVAGVFLATCFISLSIGTSVGTIVALVPVAVGLADKTGISIPFMTGVVVGGAFYGDNLSFISDTTIAATRTQGCSMRDKFRVNILIATPVALILLIYYMIYGWDLEILYEVEYVEWGKVIPYVIVLGLAIIGVNVMIVLMLGIISTGFVGMAYGDMDVFGWIASMGNGIEGMGELIIVTLLAGGVLEMVRFNGGIAFILHHLTRRVSSKRGAELSIVGLVSFANVCTANNTIAIITVGGMVNDIARQFKIDKRKSAALLDLFSCVVQGLLPFGAQLLIAAELSHSSPLSIIAYLYYPMFLGLFGLISVFIGYPRRFS